MEEKEKTIKFESLKEKSKWGGIRENAGRPEGSKNTKTKEMEKVEEEFRQRVLRSTHKLIDSQMNLAQGVQMLYRIDIDKDGKRNKPELVTDREEIESYLADDYEKNSEYYFITTERPDNKAIDSLFDRVLGKSTQKIELGGGIDLTILETDIKQLLNESPTSENSEPSTEALQDRGGEADETNGESMSNIPVDSNETEAEGLVVSSHEVREVLDSSVGSIDEGIKLSGEVGDSRSE